MGYNGAVDTISTLYDTDVVEWAERQAALLRRHAAGEKLNDPLDWANIIEEVETVGRSETSAVESLLFQALLHELKCQAWPESRDCPAWRGEHRGFLAQARRKFLPSMRQRIDLPGLYADALLALPDTSDGVLPQPVPQICSTTLDELMVTRGSGAAPS